MPSFACFQLPLDVQSLTTAERVRRNEKIRPPSKVVLEEADIDVGFRRDSYSHLIRKSAGGKANWCSITYLVFLLLVL